MELLVDPYRAACRSRGVLDRIGDRWTVLIIGAMASGEPLRFSDLLYGIEGISQKMLTQNLRALERDGIVSRTVTPSSPVRIEYRLTTLGMSLLGRTVNVVSLAGVAFAVGMVVDNAIVVLENIETWRAKGVSAPRAAMEAIAHQITDVVEVTVGDQDVIRLDLLSRDIGDRIVCEERVDQQLDAVDVDCVGAVAMEVKAE